MHRAPDSPASADHPRRGLATLTLLLLMVSAGLGGAPHASATPRMWSWPVEAPPNVARGFDLAARYGAGHRGIDISAAPGDDVRSPASGTVTFAGFVVDRPVLSIQHADGLLASYEPVVTQLRPGDVVSSGQRIGELSTSHRHTPEGALHLGVRRDGAYLDPAPLFEVLRPPAAVLLPLYR
ncbi:murein hydrolase activator EnvC family protein [Pseudoclavibacter sp. 8L]|uniref:murein hydrolase activator EnvC family protein n=1 Tax=Pseudoclavibacter sp. 8L TaxID=2653162 RepID=UPI0012F4250A|nr:M23 family metallopeptidase [Pseudoclavibacter sp. 8L]VXB49195.1 M23 family peptidase [Pseudoclavibacter sp. 8L]